jgi:hypothetical protein
MKLMHITTVIGHDIITRFTAVERRSHNGSDHIAMVAGSMLCVEQRSAAALSRTDHTGRR